MKIKNIRSIRTFAIAGIILVAGAAIFGLAATRNNSANDSKDVVSKNQRISLREPSNDGRIGSTSQIAGTYKAQQNQALLYTISSKKGDILASGIIIPDDKGNFSRNVAFDSKPQHDEALTLAIFAQDNKGTVTDQLDAAVVYRD